MQMASNVSAVSAPSKFGSESQYAWKVSLKGIYEDELLHGLNRTARSLIESEKENLVLHAVKCLEEQFLSQGNIERLTAVFNCSVWPAGLTLEDYCISETTA
jgi:hypothetical protein